MSESAGISIFSDKERRFLRGAVHGLNASPEVYKPVSSISVVGAQFHTHSLSQLFRMKGSEMVNQSISLDEFRSESIERLKDAQDLRGKIDHLGAFLKERLPVNTDTFAADCIRFIRNAKGDVTVKGLQNEFRVSERKLERKFAAEVGVSPRFFIKMMRFRQAFETLKNGHGKSMTELAYELGYFDQAHFINEVKRLSGLTPKQLQQRLHSVPVNQRGYTRYLIDPI